MGEPDDLRKVTRRPTPARQALGAGCGLRAGLAFTGSWAHRLRDIPNPRRDLQDNGIHFRVEISAF